MATRDRDRIEAQARSACEAGDHAAATTVAIEGFGPEILGFLLARLRDETAAGDVFAMFCEDVWKGISAFQWRCSLRVWSYTLARHAANRYVQRAHRRPERNVPLSNAPLSQLAAQVKSTTLPHLRTAVKSRMRQLREKLSAEEQTLLILRVDKGMSWKELAEVMAFDGQAPSDATIRREAARLRKRFQLAKNKLRDLAEAEGLVSPS